MTLKSLLSLWAHIRAAGHMYQTMHWQSRGPVAYADHLLFERLYSARAEELDGLAELIAGEYGSDKLDPVSAWASAAPIIGKMLHAGNPIAVADAVLRAVEECNAECANAPHPASVQNFVSGVGTSNLTAMYLLQQRFGKQ